MFVLLKLHLSLNKTFCRYALRHIRTSACSRGTFEPDEEKRPITQELMPDLPEYDTVNVSLRGYDFTILESFTSHCHKLAHRLKIDSDCYAVPPRSTRVQVYKPQSATPDREYHLNLCERVVQLENVPSTSLPIYIQAVQMSLPQGIQVELKYPCAEEDEFLYIPDKDLISLHSQLDEMEQEKTKKKKK